MGRIRKFVKWTSLTLLAIVVVGGGVLGLVLSHDSACTPVAAASGGEATMKAYSHTCYGPASKSLQFADIAKPVPKDDEVLVRVRAVSVNPVDWHTIHGVPYLARFSMGFGKPEAPRVGVDYAGVVEAVGAKVTRFKPGDEVFGGRNGAFAEYVVVREERNVVPKPANVSFAEAAAVPVAAITALQALRDKGGVKSGEKVLVVGASGGVGTYAVQIAKALGAEVTAVCSTRNLELVRSLGADHAIDYTKEDVTQGDARYDLIVDMVSTSGPRELDRILTPAGRVIIVGGAGGPEQRWLGPMIAPLNAFVMGPFLDHEMKFMLAELNPKDLAYLAELMATGRMRSAIDRTYTLAELPQALDYLETGRARGKVIVTMDAAPLAQQ